MRKNPMFETGNTSFSSLPYFFWLKVCMLNLCSWYVSMSKSFISSKNVNRQTLSFYTFIPPAATFSHASLCDIGHIKWKSMENTQYKVSRFMLYSFRIPATVTFNILHYVQSHEMEHYFLLLRKVFLIDSYVTRFIFIHFQLFHANEAMSLPWISSNIGYLFLIP